MYWNSFEGSFVIKKSNAQNFIPSNWTLDTFHARVLPSFENNDEIFQCRQTNTSYKSRMFRFCFVFACNKQKLFL